MITIKTLSFVTHKKAESLKDCQDAAKVNEDSCRYAIADGATRSFFPKWWAELLVERFCEMSTLFPNEENWKEWLYPIQSEWYKRVEETVKARNQFYLTNSFNTREPAVSTFIGLEIDKVKNKWHAVIIGDSCLFHKSKTGSKSYLIKKSEDFTDHPDAVSSFPEKDDYEPTFIGDEIQPGDIFILATDALAKWIVQHEEADRVEEVLDQLKTIKTKEQFYSFVDLARDNENIRLVNDDVTLMLISIEETETSETEEDAGEPSLEVPTSEDVESLISALAFIFWTILAGIFGFFVGALILVLILLNKS